MASGVALPRRTEMELRRYQRFGTTLGLSTGSGVAPLLAGRKYEQIDEAIGDISGESCASLRGVFEKPTLRVPRE